MYIFYTVNICCMHHMYVWTQPPTSQWLNTSWGNAVPEVRFRISSANPNECTTGMWHLTMKVDVPSRICYDTCEYMQPWWQLVHNRQNGRHVVIPLGRNKNQK